MLTDQKIIYLFFGIFSCHLKKNNILACILKMDYLRFYNFLYCRLRTKIPNSSHLWMMLQNLVLSYTRLLVSGRQYKKFKMINNEEHSGRIMLLYFSRKVGENALQSCRIIFYIMCMELML